MEPGKLFRNFGAAAQKAVSPNVVRVLQLEGGGGGGAVNIIHCSIVSYI